LAQQGRKYVPENSPLKGKTGLARIWNAFHYSMDGLREVYRHEAAFRQETVVAIPLIVAALFIPADTVARILMIGSVLLVLIVEILNSAIEANVDHVSLERHPLAKRAKDAGSAAVFVSLVNCAVVWLFIIVDIFRS